MNRFSIPRTLLTVAALITTAQLSAPAQAQVTAQMRGEAMSLMKICRADYDRLCAGVRPGGGRILACLQDHAAQLSGSCSQAMPRAQALKDNAAATGALPK
jgi:hypothetical protein